jgi:NTP pyrophosphatase (non-canonical NTP hydrolase)
MQIILTEAEEKLYLDCIAAYGPIAQSEQYLEECAEAVLAVRKSARARESMDHDEIKKRRVELIGEVVDTLNMSIQMMKILGEDAILTVWDEKINRQIKRVEAKLNPLS